MTRPAETAGLPADATSEFSDAFAKLFNGTDVSARLRTVGISLTLQRLAIAQVTLAAPAHLTADEVLSRVRAVMPELSRATVYNTLNLFKDKGLLREIIVNAEHVVFDSTTAPHFHMYDVDTGMVTDVPPGEIKVVGTPSLPPEFEVENIDLVIRVRRRRP